MAVRFLPVSLIALAFATVAYTQDTPHHVQAELNPPFSTQWFTRACQGQKLIFQCEQGRKIKLDLSTMFWGRTNQDACTGEGLDTASTTCSSTVPSPAIEACDGEAGRCEVMVDVATVGSDPCPGIHKVFEINYACELPAASAYTCEGDSMDISCPENTVIKVYSAFYGRDTMVYCNPNGVTDLPTNCSADADADIAGKLAAICDGRETCTLRVNNAYLLDPCPGTSKYLSVNYVCAACENEYGDDDSCSDWANDEPSECDLNPGWMNTMCTKACWGCGNRYDGCEDKDVDCAWWASRGECQMNEQWMADNCPHSCRTCDPTSDFIAEEGVEYFAEQCEGRWVNTNCGRGDLVLEITDVFYGRDDATTCPDSGEILTTDCPRPPSMLALAQELCDGRPSCYLGADSVWQWEDPCPGTSKYLRLTHMCRKCENVLTATTCENLKAGGQCTANKEYMMTNCFATCTGCEYADCTNVHGNDQNCDRWAPAGECSANSDFMLEQCKESCRSCSADPNVDDTCVNLAGTDSCDWWASRDECLKNPAWMKSNCKKSCNMCDPDACVNYNLNCVYWASLGECTANPQYMNANCKKACTDCGGTSEACVNAMGVGSLCDEWAALGGCASNPPFMDASCAKACGKC